MDSNIVFVSLFIFIIALSLGYLIAGLRHQKQLRQIQDQNLALKTELESERNQFRQKELALEESKKHFAASFNALSRDALNKNNEAFLQLAQEKLTQFQVEAKGSLEMKEKAIENLVKPIKEALEKTERQVHQIERERKEAYGALHKHLETMTETQLKLHGETRNLVAALKRPEVRGQWGEMTLKRLAELAGMVEYCDFFQQATVDTDQGQLRPDMIIRLPGGRDIVVDIKTPLDAYISAVEAENDETKELHLKRHARHVRDRVKELASKAYWQQFKNSPDFVVLFIPGDQFLSAALDIDPQLLEDAMKNKVILSTPTSLVALLRAIAYGWRQESLAENAEEIRSLGDELYTRMATFAEHLGKVGRSLEQGVGHYNQAVGSFNTRVMPGAKKFVEMGIQAKKDMPELEPVEKTPRQLEVES